MKLMRCPLNGWRGVDEFAYGGEFSEIPDPDVCDDQTWSAYVFMRENRRGPVAEWWFHIPSAFWFVALRNTGTGEVIDTCTVQQWRERMEAVTSTTASSAQGIPNG
jgi:sarcosine oxidase subunit delta